MSASVYQALTLVEDVTSSEQQEEDAETLVDTLEQSTFEELDFEKAIRVLTEFKSGPCFNAEKHGVVKEAILELGKKVMTILLEALSQSVKDAVKDSKVNFVNEIKTRVFFEALGRTHEAHFKLTRCLDKTCFTRVYVTLYSSALNALELRARHKSKTLLEGVETYLATVFGVCFKPTTFRNEYVEYVGVVASPSSSQESKDASLVEEASKEVNQEETSQEEASKEVSQEEARKETRKEPSFEEARVDIRFEDWHDLWPSLDENDVELAKKAMQDCVELIEQGFKNVRVDQSCMQFAYPCEMWESNEVHFGKVKKVTTIRLACTNKLVERGDVAKHVELVQSFAEKMMQGTCEPCVQGNTIFFDSPRKSIRVFWREELHPWPDFGSIVRAKDAMDAGGWDDPEGSQGW